MPESTMSFPVPIVGDPIATVTVALAVAGYVLGQVADRIPFIPTATKTAMTVTAGLLTAIGVLLTHWLRGSLMGPDGWMSVQVAIDAAVMFSATIGPFIARWLAERKTP